MDNIQNKFEMSPATLQLPLALSEGKNSLRTLMTKARSIKIDACYNFSRFQGINFIQNTRMTSSQFLNLNLKVDL